MEYFLTACEDLASLSGGHDHFYVLTHADQFDHHTVRLAEYIDYLDVLQFEHDEVF